MSTSCVMIHLMETKSVSSIVVNGLEVKRFNLSADPYENSVEYVNNLIAEYTINGFELKTFGITSSGVSNTSFISVWTLVRDGK